MTAVATGDVAALRRVERWSLREPVVLAAAVAVKIGVVVAIAAGFHRLAVVLFVLVLAAVVARRDRRVFSPDRDLADLRAAAPLLTPHGRAVAFRQLGASPRRPPTRAQRPEIEQLRAHLESLPGGMRLRSRLALRDPDARPVPRAFAVRALVAYPAIMVAPVALASSVHGVPEAVSETLGMLGLLGSPTLTFADRAARDLAVTRRLLWALLSAACWFALVVAIAAVATALA
ncbi:MAG TPA: hypothetical protein VJT75_16305 [Thermoleophilaceae bacterium]|nr:hypothetical protein [Thermoleophilaceae bacterium]